jgi:hypothetical protein
LVAQRIVQGLVGGKGLAVDASLISADVQTQSSSRQEKRDAVDIDADDVPRAVRDYLDTLDTEAFGATAPVKPKVTAHADPCQPVDGGTQGACFLCIFR